jgi:hypothetical protein
MLTFKILSSFILMTNSASLVSSWQPLGSTIIASDGSYPVNDVSLIGSIVDTSHDGRRVAVGSPGSDNGEGSISLFELDRDATSWNLLTTISGDSGEGLGDFFSLSPDGRVLAVRRHFPDAVQVFSIRQDYSLEQLGSEKKCPQGSDGQSLTLAQASSSSRTNLGGTYWIIIGCEGYDDNRGKVHVYELLQDHHGDGYRWSPAIGHMSGLNPGARFGSQTVFVQASSFRIAVSSPLYNGGQGLVQVFDGDEDTGWSQRGDDLVGNSIGELFGTSMDMSSTEYPYLIIGSPKQTQENSPTQEHGMARLFHWRSPAFGISPSWHLVDSALAGIQDGDEFGRSVSISEDGNRFAVSSNTYSCVYELQSYDNHNIVTDLIYSAEGTLQTNIALNGPGSIIFSAYTNEMLEYRVGVFLDESSFCQKPKLADEDKFVMDDFLKRATCRTYGINLPTTEQLCVETKVFWNDEFENCDWLPSYFTDSPSLIPSSQPTKTNSAAPTDSPSTFPSSSAIDRASSAPTTKDSFRPSAAPFMTSFPSPSAPRPSVGLLPSSKPSTFKPTVTKTGDPTIGVPSSTPSYVSDPVPSMIPGLSLSPTIVKTGVSTVSIPSSTPSYASDSVPSMILEPSLSPNIWQPIVPQPLATSVPIETPSASPTIYSPMLGLFPSQMTPHPTSIEGTLHVLTACHCDESQVCIKKSLKKDSGTIKICVKRESSNDFDAIAVQEFKLIQGNVTMSIIEDSQNVTDSVVSACDQGSCQIQVPVSAELFLEERQLYVVASGTLVASEENRNLRSTSHRRLVEYTFVMRFGTIILLDKEDRSRGEVKEITEANATRQSSQGTGISTAVWWLTVGLAVFAVGVVCARFYLRRKRVTD